MPVSANNGLILICGLCCMDLMRLETRTLFHFGFGSPTGHGTAGMVVPTSVYDSDFIQSKWAFCCFMRTTPNGLMKVEACKSLYDMDIKCSETALKYYPYMNRLLTSLKDYTIILDGSRWLSYIWARLRPSAPTKRAFPLRPESAHSGAWRRFLMQITWSSLTTMIPVRST